ncbi:MAG TPA: NUDIX hydrolase [Halanaerobiales bacterium]|nr:NUDIX hydrolase [Halanaerobiales bacterium]
MEKYKEKILNSNYIYEGTILNLRKDKVKLFDEHETYREVVEHSGGVAIIPVTEEGNILMVKQYRIAVDEIVLELPAGKLEEDEDVKLCAVRELEEETGYRPTDIKELFHFYTTPGYSSEKLHLFIANGLKYFGQNLDQGEYIEIVELSPNKIIPNIINGKIKDSKTIIGLLWYLNRDNNNE